MSRVPTEPAGRGRVVKTARAAPPAPAVRVPEATLSRAGGPVALEITFGRAQHGTYTIQLFDPRGTTELARETGLSTDDLPDRFELKPTPARLDQHILQWFGAVDGFSPSPAQQFSVIVEVIQNRVAVPGGHVEKRGPLTTTQAFLGIVRLVTE